MRILVDRLQIAGQKLWSVWPDSAGRHLPRLREPRSAVDLPTDGAASHRLAAGDWLYIPRGWPHVAKTAAGSGASAHLSFSVDLEPPFELVGVLHIALRLFCREKGGAARTEPKRRRTEGAGPPAAAELRLHAEMEALASSEGGVVLRRAAFPPRATGCDGLRTAAELWGKSSTSTPAWSEPAWQRLEWLGLLDAEGPREWPSEELFAAAAGVDAAECAALRQAFVEACAQAGKGSLCGEAETAAMRIGEALDAGRQGLARGLWELRPCLG